MSSGAPGTRLRVAALSDVGRARKVNEDAFGVTDLETAARLEPDRGVAELPVGPRGVLVALSDGMGGHRAGEVASALVLDSLRASLQDAAAGESVEATVTAAVRRANAEVRRAAAEEGRHGMGATLTAVLFRPDAATVAEVGDSRAYLLRQGVLKQLTRDQSLVQLLVDQGALSPEQARSSSRKNVLLQAVGQEDDVRAAISQLELRRGDRFLVCCDGLTNAVGDDELQEFLGDPDPSLACRRMVDLANERGGKDNLTALVVHVDGEGLRGPGASERITQTFEVVRSFSDPT